MVSNLSSVQEEFQVVASNGYHQKKAYELMHEILKTEKLLKEHPEESRSHYQKWQMIERLSRKMGIAVLQFRNISRFLITLLQKPWKNSKMGR